MFAASKVHDYYKQSSLFALKRVSFPCSVTDLDPYQKLVELLKLDPQYLFSKPDQSLFEKKREKKDKRRQTFLNDQIRLDFLHTGM